MLNIGDKIKCVKANPLFSFPVGTIFEVTDIQGTVLAVYGEYKVDGMSVGEIKGVMSYDEYEKYFEKYEEEKTAKSEYTNWETLDYCGMEGCVCNECPYNLLCSFQENQTIQFKHNNKKVAIKAKLYPTPLYPDAHDGKVLTVYTTRHPDDKFDLDKALKIGFERLNKEIAKQTIKMANKNIAQY